MRVSSKAEGKIPNYIVMHHNTKFTEATRTRAFATLVIKPGYLLARSMGSAVNGINVSNAF